jgi:succinoglycan biosynthesis transport protein ExoP
LLGRVLSLLGKRVLIIDADLRRAEVHGRLNLNASPGLVELLAREASMSEVVQRDEATGLCVVSTGRPSSNASELLHSERLQDVLDRTAADYDLVIIDSPPTMAVADARMLSHHADVTIFVARWAVTRREVVAMAIRNIREAGGNIGGIVLSRVNVRRHSAYGYGDSGAYYGQLQKYYKKS